MGWREGGCRGVAVGLSEMGRGRSRIDVGSGGADGMGEVDLVRWGGIRWGGDGVAIRHVSQQYCGAFRGRKCLLRAVHVSKQCCRGAV